jgi:hypothetical protein
MYSSRGWSYSSGPSSPRPLNAAYRRRRLRLPRLPRPGPLPITVVLLAGVAWYHFAFSGFATRGQVLDLSTGRPLAGARVWSSHASSLTDAEGRFVLEGVKPPESIAFDAPGYTSLTARAPAPFEGLVAGLDPIAVDLLVTDAETGRPVAGAAVSGSSGGDQPLAEDGRARIAPVPEDGHVRIAPVLPEARFRVTASGYAPAEVAYTGQSPLRVSLSPKLVGRVTDARTGQPLAGARVAVGDVVLRTDSNGAYELPRSTAGDRLVVLLPGYRRGELDLSQRPSTLDLALQPNDVRAIYMTYFAIGGEEYRAGMYELLDTTEVNAVVIDVKGDYGLLSYRSDVPLAQQIGANDSPTIADLDGLLRSLHQHGAYVIARIDVFKDNVLALNAPRAGLDLSIKDRRTGRPWIDGEHLAWVDGFQPAAWDYNVALAREAIERGFDEVQFDYVRFATDPSPGSSIEDIVYSRPFNAANRVDALHQFLQRAHAAVNAAGGYLGIDTFGYTTWWEDDGGIGQDLRVLADDIDYYCPMVYPSTFNAGVPGLVAYPGVVSRPYDVVYQSLMHVQDKLAGKPVVLRPWLQYFDDYPWATRTRYDAPQIEAQKKAASDSSSRGWMLWNPGSLFRRGGLAPKQVAVQAGT